MNITWTSTEISGKTHHTGILIIDDTTISHTGESKGKVAFELVGIASEKFVSLVSRTITNSLGKEDLIVSAREALSYVMKGPSANTNPSEVLGNYFSNKTHDKDN